MRLATVLTPPSDENFLLAAQCGVTDFVCRYPGPDPRALRDSANRAKSFGLNLTVVEGYLPIENLKVGCDDGRERIAMQQLIEHMGDLGIKLLCYNSMAGTDWTRTRLDAPERGGALVTAFHLPDAEKSVLLGYRPSNPEHEAIAQRQTEVSLWDHLRRMLDALLPIAEKNDVTLAMHPDDPPVERLLGKVRIMNSVASLQRLMNEFPSPHHGICFCVGTIATMGVAIPETIRLFGEHIRYVHFRDVKGSAESFTETFHDNGQTNMVAAMQAFQEIGFSGPIRPDHVPQLVGEEGGEPGYTMLGRLFAYGYIRGLMQATRK